MRRLRVKGLVAFADNVRRELSQPITPKRLGELRETVASTLRGLDSLVASRNQCLRLLPAPSRKAYLYLAGLDGRSVRTADAQAAQGYLPGSVRLTGLRSFFDRLLDGLAGVDPPSDAHQVHASVRDMGDKLVRNMRQKTILPEHLKPESRSSLAWLTYFQDRNRFDEYVTALRVATPILGAATRGSRRFPVPVIIHFRPTSSLYRLRAAGGVTRLRLPTPMITFDAGGFAELGSAVFRRNGSAAHIVRRTLGSKYQAVVAELGQLAGDVNTSSGVYRDLDESFDRVNATYFEATMNRPRLTWSRRITGSKFGHYDSVHDSLMVSSSLDSMDVPEHVLDFIVYHELLHKRHGISFKQGRQFVHTPQFRRDEKRFAHFAPSQFALNSLARRYSQFA